MAKILTGKELGEIVRRATNDDSLIECADSYEHFLEDLADLVCNHFGGSRGGVHEPDDSLPEWTVAIRFNECVPPDGGVFKDYDTDVAWKDGVEQ
jgi:hypothetical protein